MPPQTSQLPKAYSPIDTEPGIRARWDAAGAFHADPQRVLSGEKPPYCILIPPPNVTAALHLGHALTYTIQDILTRAHRMMGFETLWMPGTDHAGIATQAVVERRVLEEEGKRRTDFKGEEGRAEFVARIQAYKDEYEATIIEQLKVIGCSCDWARLRFTMDEQCAAAVREAFFLLFKDGLIYRGKRLVNWDPVLQTAVADDETEDIEIDGHFYYLRYPLIHPHQEGKKPQNEPQPMTWSELARRGYPGADAHPEDQQAWLTVATTRPETYLGDTAVAVNPHDPRAKSLRALCAQLPLVGRVIPIIEDDYVVLPAAMQEDPIEAAADPKALFATGFLKVTPAHDQNDYDLYFRHKAEIDRFRGADGGGLVNIFSPDAKISDKHGWNDIGTGGAHIFVGLPREAARKKVIDEFRARSLMEDTKPYRHSVKHSDRTKAAIEPYLSDQWYVRVTDDRMRGSALRALDQSPLRQQGVTPDRAGSAPSASSANTTLTFHPARYAKTYQTWHENIRDWCISRQLWWGHRIPVWTRQFCVQGNFTPSQEVGETVAVHGDWDLSGCAHLSQRIAEDEFRAVVCIPSAVPAPPPVIGTHRTTEFNPGGQYAFRATSMKDLISELEREGFSQDPDVLDTWFSSALWPMSTMGWPDPAAHNPDLNRSLLEAFNPSSVLCTAREIITLWVSRMTMFNRYFMPEGWPERGQPPAGAGGSDLGRGAGPVPFRDVFIHAMIQDGEGRKMSKSLGNGVDPRDIIASHGADAMRFTLCHMTTQTQDVRMPVVADPATGKNTSPKFDFGRNFCNKLWNAARLIISIFDKHRDQDTAAAGKHAGPDEPFSLIDRWMLSRLAASLDEINESLANYEFSNYAQSVYDLLWRDFCDWYLETIKPTINESPRQRAVLAHVFESILRILHPIIPFITESIWEHIREIETEPIQGVLLGPSEKGGLLATAGWPVLSPSLRDSIAEDRFERARTLITLIREVRAQQQVLPKRKVVLHAPAELVGDLASAGSLAYIESLAGLEPVAGQPPAPPTGAPSIALRFESYDLALSSLADRVDAAAEQERRERRLAELTKSIAAMAKRLDNPGYIAKAPPKLVEESRAQLAEAQAELARLQEA